MRRKLRRVLIRRRHAEDIEGRKTRRQEDKKTRRQEDKKTKGYEEDFYLRRIRKALKV